MQIRNIHAKQAKRAKAKANLQKSLDHATKEEARWETEVQRCTDLLAERDEHDERLAGEECDLAKRLAESTGCRVYKHDEDSEDSYGEEWEDDDGGYGRRCEVDEEGDEDVIVTRARGRGRRRPQSQERMLLAEVPFSVPAALRQVLEKVNPTASAHAKAMHEGICGWLQSAGIRGVQEVEKEACDQGMLGAREPEDIIRELAHTYRTRAGNADEEAGPLLQMVEALLQKEAENKEQREQAAAAAPTQAQAKIKEKAALQAIRRVEAAAKLAEEAAAKDLAGRKRLGEDLAGQLRAMDRDA